MRITEHSTDGVLWSRCSSEERGDPCDKSIRLTRVVEIVPPPKPVDLLRAAAKEMRDAWAHNVATNFSDGAVLRHARACMAYDELLTPENLA